MPNFNKVILIGHLTKDVKLSFLPSNTPVAEFGIAVNRKYKQDGKERQDVCFVDCQNFGKRAEVISKFFKKGDPILVEGHLKFETWEAKDGTKRSKHGVFVENFEFVGGQKGSQLKPSNETQQGNSLDVVDGDIPF